MESRYIPDRLSVFLSPNRILLGIGAAEETGREVKALGAKKALIVTDPGVVEAGLVDQVKSSLESEDIEVGVFQKVEPEPPPGW